MTNKLPDLSTNLPVYKLTVPTTGELTDYQPFTRNQEKSILLAAQEEDGSMLSTLLNIMKSCCKAKITTMPDLSYIATHIRAKSQGADHTFILKECENKDCDNKKIKIKTDNILDNIKIKNKENLHDIYEVNENLKFKIVPLNLGTHEEMQKMDSMDKLELDDAIIANSIEYVIHNGNVIKDFTQEEMISKIIKNLLPTDFDNINKKMKELISIVYEIKYTCPKCKKELMTEISDFLFFD